MFYYQIIFNYIMKESKVMAKSFQKNKQEPIKEIPSDFSVQQRKKIIDLVHLNTNLFLNWTLQEIDQLVQISKFYSFNKSTVLARKDQIVDYFGIILSGTALALYDDIVQAQLDTYEMIGYMAFMNMKGTLTHFFDIVCENDGIILAIRLSELRGMQTKYPELFIRLSDLASSKCIDVIKYQYSGNNFNNQMKVLGLTLSDKRINQLFEICGNTQLKQFWQNLQIRQRIIFNKNVKFIEMNQKDIIINRQIMHSMVLIILKGQCISYETENNGNSSNIIPQGSVIGIESFISEKPFNQNIYCRQKGIYLMISKKNFLKILKEKSSLGIALYHFFVHEQGKHIKNNFEKLSRSQTNDFFIEINLKKKRKKIEVNQNSKIFSPFIKVYDIIPLHENQFYKETFKSIQNQKRLNLEAQKLKSLNKLQVQHTSAKTKNNQALKLLENQKPVVKIDEKKQKIIQYQKSLMIWQTFYSEKKAELMKKGAKALSQSIISLNLQKNITQQEEEQTTKRLSKLQNQNAELKNQTDILKSQILNLKKTIKSNNERVIETNTRIKKMEMHKQLLKKRNYQTNTIAITSKKTSALSLKDVFSQQLKQNSIYRLVAKCAYKWLYQTRKRLKNKNKHHHHNI